MIIVGEAPWNVHCGRVMELRELLTALHEEMKDAGISSAGSSVNLAFVAKRERNGEVEVDFVDAASMSKPRPEELHRLELSLADAPPSVFQMVDEDGDGKPDKLDSTLDSPPAFRHSGRPPALPTERQD